MTASFAETAAVVRHLEQAGIRALPIKGCVFAALVGDDPSARPSQDIDLLVAPSQRAGAVAALARLGYRARPRSNGLIRELHLIKPGRACIDLHWSPAGATTLLPLDFDRLWRDRQCVADGEDSVPYPSNPWLVVFTALFILRKLPVVEQRYVDDLGSLIEHFPALDWRQARTIAQDSRSLLMTTVGLHLSAELCGSALPAAALRQFPLNARAERLIDSILPLFDDERAQARHEFVSEIAALLGIGRFREHWRDRLYPFVVFPLILLSPDDKDAERAALSGRPVWRERLGRLPEVLQALARHHRSDWQRARYRRSLSVADKVVRPAAQASLHLVAQEGLLLQARSQALLGLNTAAAWIWCQLEDGRAVGRIIIDYAATFSTDSDDAADTVRTTLLDWWDRGLIDGSPSTEASLPAAPAPVDWGGAVPAAAVVRRYRILDRTIEIGMPGGEAAARIDGLLGHFADPGAPADRLDVVIDSGDYLIVRDGQLVERAASLSGLAPQVKSAALVAAINAQPFELYLHAAMLWRDGRAILFPAAPGSGKTCLSAALSRRGYRYHTDEVTLLFSERLHARGVPTALTVKAPAWTLLAGDFPELEGCTIHQRIDGKSCRYLPPPVIPGDPDLDRCWPVGSLVFPRYDADEPTGIVRLGAVEALRRVLGECLALPQGLDPARVDRLTRWIEPIDAYSLSFRNFDEAAAALQEIGLTPDVAAREPA